MSTPYCYIIFYILEKAELKLLKRLLITFKILFEDNKIAYINYSLIKDFIDVYCH